MVARQPNVLIVLMDQLQRGALGFLRLPSGTHARLSTGWRPTASGSLAPTCRCRSAPPRAHPCSPGATPTSIRCIGLVTSTEFPADWQAEVGPLVHRTPLPESVPSLGQAFKAAGYRMGLHRPLAHGRRRNPAPRLDRLLAHLPLLERRPRLLRPASRTPRPGRDVPPRSIAAPVLQTHWPTGIFPSGASTIPVEHARTSWAVDRAIEFLDSRDDRPWVFCCSIKDPHPPIISPGDFPDLVSPDDVDLPVSLADDLSSKPRTLRMNQSSTNGSAT